MEMKKLQRINNRIKYGESEQNQGSGHKGIDTLEVLKKYLEIRRSRYT